jgi:hypothetical protein
VTLSNGVTLDIDDDPTLVSDNVYRYGFSDPLVPGTITVAFLAGSFGDSAGFLNNLEVESLSVAQPAADLVNLNDGATYSAATPDSDGNLPDEDINNEDSSYFAGADGRYFEFVLTPAKGASLPAGAPFSLSEVHVLVDGSPATGITLTSVERVLDGRPRRIASACSMTATSPPLRSPRRARSRSDRRGSVAGQRGQPLRARSPRRSRAQAARTFFISSRAACASTSTACCPTATATEARPDLRVRGLRRPLDQETRGGGTGPARVRRHLQVVYLGNISSVAGKLILDTTPNTGDAVTVGELLGDLGFTGVIPATRPPSSCRASGA